MQPVENLLNSVEEHSDFATALRETPFEREKPEVVKKSAESRLKTVQDLYSFCETEFSDLNEKLGNVLNKIIPHCADQG